MDRASLRSAAPTTGYRISSTGRFVPQVSQRQFELGGERFVAPHLEHRPEDSEASEPDHVLSTRSAALSLASSPTRSSITTSASVSRKEISSSVAGSSSAIHNKATAPNRSLAAHSGSAPTRERAPDRRRFSRRRRSRAGRPTIAPHCSPTDLETQNHAACPRSRSQDFPPHRASADSARDPRIHPTVATSPSSSGTGSTSGKSERSSVLSAWLWGTSPGRLST